MSKTLVLVVSDKGGTGKSTWARAYADWLRRKHPTAFLADADGTVCRATNKLRGRDNQDERVFWACGGGRA